MKISLKTVREDIGKINKDLDLCKHAAMYQFMLSLFMETGNLVQQPEILAFGMHKILYSGKICMKFP